MLTHPHEQGALGLVLNISLFLGLLAAEASKPKLTEGEQHWRKQVITFFGCTSNLLLAVAGVGLAAAMGAHVPSSKSLIIPLVWASIQAYVSPSDAVRHLTKTLQAVPG